MDSARAWDPPSPRVAELIRAGTAKLLENSDRLFAELDEVAFEAAKSLLEIEPRLADVIRASTRANFGHWASANFHSPGLPVEATLTPETTALARDIVRFGYDDTILRTFHSGQNVAVRVWTDVVFELTSDPDELRELLQVISRSVFAYIDDTVSALYELVNRERSQLTDATHFARMEVVALILEGAPISSRRASDRLRYDVARSHLAAIIWSDEERVDAAKLERAADVLARTMGAPQPLRLLVSPSTMWVWVSGGEAPDLSVLREELASTPRVRVALGTADSGLNGFRRSHLDAVATQRLMRRLPGTVLATYDDVEVVALATQDPERAVDFVRRTLGELATAPPELRETVRVYLREGSSATHAARAMYAHRNTILGRLDRARELLPRPLEGRGLQVGLALEIAHVFGR